MKKTKNLKSNFDIIDQNYLVDDDAGIVSFENIDFSNENDEVVDLFAKQLALVEAKRKEIKNYNEWEMQSYNEEQRLKSVRKMLGRKCSEELNDAEQLYLLLQVNPDAQIDLLGNTALHYIADPTQVTVKNANGCWVKQKSTERQKEALESWLEVVVTWVKPNAFIKNFNGLTAVDVATYYNADYVNLLCKNDLVNSEELKNKAIARAYIASYFGLCKINNHNENDLFEAILNIKDNLEDEILLIQNDIFDTSTFKEKIKLINFSNNEYNKQIKLLLK